VTARVNSQVGKLGLGDGFRPFRTKGDDGGRHRRRRQVNRIFMSWRFDRPDFPDLESHSGCRASGPDGRYFPPPEVTPLIVVLQVGLPYSSSWKNLHLKDLGRVPEVRYLHTGSLEAPMTPAPPYWCR